MFRSPILALILLAFSQGLAQNNPFAGVWQFSYNDPAGGPTLVEVIFMANGTYSQQIRSNQTMFYFPGTYRVVQRGLLRITFDQKNMYPRQTCGPLGCSPIYYPDGETHNYSFPNANTLIMHLASCPPNQCSMTLRRVR